MTVFEAMRITVTFSILVVAILTLSFTFSRKK